MRILHTPLCQVCNGRANKVTSVILTWDYSNVLCPMFPLALLCVVPYHVLGMFCQYWHLSIHTAWSKPGLARSPRSPALYVLHVRVLVTRGQSSGRAVVVATTEVPVTVPLHAWSGQGQSLVTISSQLVRRPIIIITRSPGMVTKKPAGGRTLTHMAGLWATWEQRLGFKLKPWSATNEL